MTDLMHSPTHGRNNGSTTMDIITSPSLRGSNRSTTTTNDPPSTTTASTAAADASEPKLFSPRSTAAMALSSISQIFSAAPPTTAMVHAAAPSHPTITTTTGIIPFRETTMMTSQPIHHHHHPQSLTSSSEYRSKAEVSTMQQQAQLPPPQSLFRTSTVVGTKNDSASPSYADQYDVGGPLPFIPQLPLTQHPFQHHHHPQYNRIGNGEAPSVPPHYYHHQHHPHHHHHHHSNFGTADGTSTGMPYSSRNETEPQSQPPYYAPSTASSHPAMMMMMKRQPSFPTSSISDELPSSSPSTYTSPQQPPPPPTLRTMTTGGSTDTSAPHSHLKPARPHSYDVDSQMLLPSSSSNHHHMAMMMGQSQPQSYPSSTTTTMTPAAGTKRDFSSTVPVPNHWTTPAPGLNSIASHIHGTPSHNHFGSRNNATVASHHPQQQSENHHPQMTPYHPIHRCSSYGSASSSNPNHTTPYDAGPIPPHPSQFLPPQVVTSGQYHPRSVSWSNNEPPQWVPYSGPPHYMSIVPHQQQYYPTPSQMIPTYPYVTPTPHKKKQKLGVDNTRTPSKLLSVNVFHPPNAPLTKKKKSPASLVKKSPAVSQSTMTPVHEDQTPEVPPSTTTCAELAAIVEEAQKKYNRKNKSLGLLAESFLSHFTDKRDKEGNDLFQEIMVDRLSIDLSVERRRIYDVVNILEALQVIIKMGKNTYHWMGRQHLPRQFALLQNEAIEAWPEHAAKSGFHSMEANAGTVPRKDSKDHEAGAFVGAANLLDPNSEGSNKSLTRLSQLFLQVFLVCDEPLSLPQASDLIHGGRSTNAELLALGMKAGDSYPTDEKRLQQMVARGLKTKIRRLYDIANVFLSVGLLRKSENRTAATPDGKRPQYFLNYHLSIHDIRSLYETLPRQMIESKSPFSEEQLLKLKKTSSVRAKVKYFGLSEPTETSAVEDDPTSTMVAESSLPMTKDILIHSPTPSVSESQSATESATLLALPSSTMNSDSACYVKEAATPYSQSSSTNDVSNIEDNSTSVTSSLAVELPVNHSSITTAPSCSTSMFLTDAPHMKLNLDIVCSDLHHDDVDGDSAVGGDTQKRNQGSDSVGTAATVSPNNSSTSIDLLLNTSATSTSPSSSSTSSTLSPRRVSLEK